MEDDLAAQFETNGRRLQSVACRMLGSLTEAGDAVQETWVRLYRLGQRASTTWPPG
jgi:RNA polymerase sigma-70 factor (ECF subfamily)